MEEEKNLETLSEEAINLKQEQLIKCGIVEIFPKIDKIPRAIATKFLHMIKCYLETKEKCPVLKKMICFKRLGKVFDNQGRLVCYFKESEDAKKEAAVYILDHPLSSHRSTSSDLIGFGGATPTVFIRTNETSGSLVAYVENNGVVGDYTPFKFKTLRREIHKLCIFHMRFGSADCHNRNTVTKIDGEGIHRLTPIDHEECFTAKYTQRRVWWAEKTEADDPLTEEMVNYVAELNVDGDIAFLKTCGWDVPSDIAVPFKMFTLFLKKAVQHHLTPSHMVCITTNAEKLPDAFHLCNMVSGDSGEKMETRLREYAAKFLKP